VPPVPTIDVAKMLQGLGRRRVHACLLMTPQSF